MKMKCAVCLLLVCLLAFLSSCSTVEIEGIENYSPTDCSYGLTKYLFPGDHYLTMFEYEESGYWYSDKSNLLWGHATVLAYLRYSPEDYEEAKSFCMEEFLLSSQHQFTHSGYEFAEHYCHDVLGENGDLVLGCNYPELFNMFAYNDESCMLVFLGYYNNNPNDPTPQLAKTDFEMFLTSTYPVFSILISNDD